MKSWKQAARDGVVSGSIPSILSTLALALCAKRETGSPYSATNAVSHWVWGDRAYRHRGISVRYTALGYAIHHASASFWAVLQEKFLGEKMDRMTAGPLLLVSTAMAGVACFTDYQLTPQRLHPGYEAHLSTKSLFAVYAVFGLGLALGAHAIRRNKNGRA